MKISFLGTSAGWPLPRLGCECQICTSRDPKDKRTRPSVLINDEVLIDCGPDIYHQLVKRERSGWSVKKLKALVITHAHPDHILGFYDLTHLYNFKDQPKLYTTHETLLGLRHLFPWPINPFRLEVVRPNEIFEVGHTRFSLIPAVHGNFPTFGVKVKANKLAGYFPDVRKIPKSYQKTCRDFHLLILDGSSLGKEGQARNHQSILEGITLAKHLKAKNVFFTHLGHKTGRHEDLEEFVQENGGRGFHIAFDGLELET